MRRRVLVVDDNVLLAENLAELLDLSGFEVTVLTSPLAVLQKNESLEFDAALLDVRMPGVDGIELLGELSRAHPEATFVLMTAFTAESRLEGALRAGATAVLGKPLPIDRLLTLLA